MSNSFPKRIQFIVEGNEEKAYLEKILSFSKINKEIYYFPDIINAKGASNLYPRYQFEIQKGFSDIVIIFCDGDKNSSQFKDTVDKIGSSFFRDKNDCFEIIVFANPVTLQIVVLHFDDVKLTSISKKGNRPVVEQLTGIKNYDAKEKQIKQMMAMIHESSLAELEERLKGFSEDINVVPSTNFLKLLLRLKGNDTAWIDEIQKKLK